MTGSVIDIVKGLLLPVLNYCLRQVEAFLVDVILPAVRSAGMVMLDFILIEVGALQRPRFSADAGL